MAKLPKLVHLTLKIRVEEHDGDVKFQTVDVEIWQFCTCTMKIMQY